MDAEFCRSMLYFYAFRLMIDVQHSMWTAELNESKAVKQSRLGRYCMGREMLPEHSMKYSFVI